MTAVSTIVQDAMFEASILGADETPSSEDAQYAVRTLNRLIGSWANENLLCYATTEETFNTVSNQISYSTSLLSSRPTSVDSMYLLQGGVSYPIDLIDEQTYNAIAYKTAAGIPSQCFYDTTYPNGSFNFYLAPNGVFEVHVISRKPLTSTLVYADSVTLPDGYEQMIVTCLGRELCRPFKVPVSPELAMAAIDAKAWLKRTNYVPLQMKSVMDESDDISNTMIYRGF